MKTESLRQIISLESNNQKAILKTIHFFQVFLLNHIVYINR